jgi:hypothetical protein
MANEKEKGTPAESPTRAFQLKLDDWMTEVLGNDLASPDEAAKDAQPKPEAAPATAQEGAVTPPDPSSSTSRR